MKQIIEELILQIVVTTRNDDGDTVDRSVSTPITVFKATSPNVWEAAAAIVEKFKAEAEAGKQ